MRHFSCLGIACLAVVACAPKEQKAYKGPAKAVMTMVSAARDGDAKRWASVCSSNYLPPERRAKVLKEGKSPLPNWRVEVESVVERSYGAAVFCTEGKRHSAFYVIREDGKWKVDEIYGSKEPFIAPVYLPPDGGAFVEAGSPWAKSASAGTLTANGHDRTYECDVRATRDDVFLYVRLTCSDQLPKPGLPMTERMAFVEYRRNNDGKDPSHITVPAEQRDFFHLYWLYVELEQGKGGAASRRSYKVSIGNGTKTIGRKRDVHARDYDIELTDTKTRKQLYRTREGLRGGLLVVRGNTMDIRFPLEALDFDPASAGEITLVWGQQTRKRYTVPAFE